MSTMIAEQTRQVVLAHGGGGELMQELIRDRLLPPLRNATLEQLGDGAVLPWAADRLVFTTDSYVVRPVEFPGGDIGRLAVCGTVNDLAVMGAVPVAISLGLILEEGCSLDLLDRVVRSIADSAHEADVRIVTGDTKVIERRGDETPGLMINTAGVGSLAEKVCLSIDRVTPGDRVLINGPIAEHGLTIMSQRNGLEFDTPLRSDAAPLNRLIARLVEAGSGLKFMRDATRGGLAGVLADISEHTHNTVEIEEDRIPLSATAWHAAEMLGLDPLQVANEGKVVCVVAPDQAGEVLRRMQRDPHGRNATCIGVVTESQPPLVELITRLGGRRIVQRPYGEDLPRIC